MEEQILAALKAKGAMKAGDIATELNVDKKEVDKTIKALIKEEKVFSPKRCFYDAK